MLMGPMLGCWHLSGRATQPFRLLRTTPNRRNLSSRIVACGSGFKIVRACVRASRDVFARHGYVPVFLDVHDAAHGTPARAYEDWYVHPDLVDMTYVRELQRLNEARYTPHPATGRSIGGVDLTYPTK